MLSNNTNYNLVVAKIEGWMATYYCSPLDGSGGIGGPIATYWTSSPYMAGPYVMSSYGLIRGLCARAGDENASEARLRAENLALYYLRSQDPTTGKVVCCWGEEPFSGNGLVQQASVAAALWDLHRVWPDKEWTQAAELCWRGCLTNPAIWAGWTVHNQALRACEALILGIQSRGDSKPTAKEKVLLHRIGRRVAEAQWQNQPPVAGGIPQARSDDNLIMPYQGKCLTPLVMLGSFLNAPEYLEVARKLGDLVLSNLGAGGDVGGIKGKYIPTGDGLPGARRLYRCRRLLPFLEGNLRRHRRRQITGWQLNPWPQWIARGIDTARGLDRLGKALGEDQYTHMARAMVRAALGHQSPLGGLRNTLGFFGTDPDELGGLVWQDVAPIPRWNSYAVQFLHELAAGTPVLSPLRPSEACRDTVSLAKNLTWIETPEEIRVIDAAGRTVWELRKGHRWGQPFRPLAEWCEGGPFQGFKGH
jgi:hypothetical protein